MPFQRGELVVMFFQRGKLVVILFQRDGLVASLIEKKITYPSHRKVNNIFPSLKKRGQGRFSFCLYKPEILNI